MNFSSISNYLTIDVEDYFQVSAFEKISSPEKWDSYESRVVKNTTLILDLLDRVAVKATFFIVGWVAEKNPRLVKEIFKRGHELGCHSFFHKKVYELSPDEFYRDTQKAKKVIEDISGAAVSGFRAPSYSITKKSMWALDILEDLGFSYDSSIFPIYHDVYGVPDAPRFEYRVPGKKLIEFPISTSIMLGRKIPVAGGGYFRLFPYGFTKMALQKINGKEKKPFVFYLHPWEVDPGQPEMKGAGWRSRFRHYNNLEKTEGRFIRLLDDFQFAPFAQSPSLQVNGN